MLAHPSHKEREFIFPDDFLCARHCNVCLAFAVQNSLSCSPVCGLSLHHSCFALPESPDD